MNKLLKIGDICEILNGYAFKSKKYIDSGIRIIRITNVQKGFIEDKDPQYYPINYCSEISKYMLEAGDILISLTGNVGRVGILEADMLPAALNQRVACLRVKQSGLVSKPFLFQYLNSDTFERQCIFSAKGVAQKNMSTEWLKECIVSFPPLEEQESIAYLFSKIDGMIVRYNKQRRILDGLIKSRFIELFGDPMANSHRLPIVEFGSVLTVAPQNGLYKPLSEYVTNGTGTPILRIDGFYNGKISDFRNLKRLHCSDEEIQRYLLHEGDIVINRVNSIEYLGKCGLVKGLYEDTVFESNMMRLHVDETKFDACYVTYLLCTKYIYNQILSKSKKAVNQASINQKDVQSFLIYMPSLSLQHQFSDFVEQIDKSKLAIQKSLEKLDILKKSLMQKYFG